MSKVQTATGEMILTQVGMLPVILDMYRKKSKMTAKEFLSTGAVPIDPKYAPELSRVAFEYCSEFGHVISVISPDEIEDILVFDVEVLEICVKQFCYLLKRDNVIYTNFATKPRKEVLTEFKRKNRQRETSNVTEQPADPEGKT